MSTSYDLQAWRSVQNSELIRQIDELRADAIRQKAILRDYKDTNDFLLKENDTLRAENARLQASLDDMMADNATLEAERDEWERKSKNNGLAAMIGLGRIEELEAKIEDGNAKLSHENARLRAALEVYATVDNWYPLITPNGITDMVDPWSIAQAALGVEEK